MVAPAVTVCACARRAMAGSDMVAGVRVVSTAPYHGYQVLFSPYSPTKIAFTGAQNYGIQGERSGDVTPDQGAWLVYDSLQGLEFWPFLKKVQVDSERLRGMLTPVTNNLKSDLRLLPMIITMTSWKSPNTKMEHCSS